ncbi:Fe-S protein assembly co-chaperone HscB [Buchnera aphidicola (Aphis fabae)]|uniref:Co-chaperone protein HscB n=1 Tax=Buchnera aphidicola (Aphis fabae) TaxID=571430 RepID=A0A5J6ZFM2_9GAMM|nr:Fe-S protein assembly co-chaperone HscB [Buchnera aphidicola]QFQ32746.1 Fe-S protein assembly co-chaperone HscB [Buchnera aphidicola (Aphis fabae)]
MNYFTLFTLPMKFKINKDLLDKNFYKLQLQFHPDLFINDSESKKQWVLEKSIKINKGYKILNNSLDRSIYLLLLNGIKVNQEKLLSKNQCFLKKYFFLYEELEILKTRNNSNVIHFNNFLKKIESEIKDCENIINYEFQNKNWNKIINVISQLLFLTKIKKNLKT